MSIDARRVREDGRHNGEVARLVVGAGQVLDLIRNMRASTISELAAALGVSRSTIVQRLESLIDAGLVREEEPVNGARGRPANGYLFAADSRLILATHTGLTGTLIGITDLTGEILAEVRRETDIDGSISPFLDVIEREAESLVAGLGRQRADVGGIAAGFPSVLELRQHRRSVESEAAWEGDALQVALAERFNVPALVDRDVALMAAGERSIEWPEAEVVVCLKLGTAISSAIVINGTPVAGDDGYAGELGHLKVPGSEALCVCGATGCLDAVAGGAALARELVSRGIEARDVRDVVALAERGDPVASAVIRDAGRRIGESLASLVDILNPRVICAWGFLADTDTQLFAGIRERLYELALPASTANLVLTRTRHGENAGLHAAALSIIAQLLAPETVESWLRHEAAIDGRSTASR